MTSLKIGDFVKSPKKTKTGVVDGFEHYMIIRWSDLSISVVDPDDPNFDDKIEVLTVHPVDVLTSSFGRYVNCEYFNIRGVIEASLVPAKSIVTINEQRAVGVVTFVTKTRTLAYGYVLENPANGSLWVTIIE